MLWVALAHVLCLGLLIRLKVWSNSLDKPDDSLQVGPYIIWRGSSKARQNLPENL